MMMLSWKNARRVVVFVIGMTVLVIGVAAIVLPVLQAWLIIPLGLAILATEFVWARRLLDKTKAKARQVFRGRTSPTGGEPARLPDPGAPTPPLSSNRTASNECGPHSPPEV